MRLLWKTNVPGNRPLATPAIADGRLFLGGGFGSHEFYAFDLLTGAMVWQYRTHDDGPTAAVVEDGHVVFNTESCELEVLTLEGKPVWKKWLGDPLMSMPAVAAGRIYTAWKRAMYKTTAGSCGAAVLPTTVCARMPNRYPWAVRIAHTKLAIYCRQP